MTVSAIRKGIKQFATWDFRVALAVTSLAVLVTVMGLVWIALIAISKIMG